VTVVKCLDVFGLDLKDVTNSLKKRFSCSVTIHESIPGAADGAR
jgi:translation initiation factor 1 (eIF-1/SUI1)